MRISAYSRLLAGIILLSVSAFGMDDFAPLAKGDTWTYVGTQNIVCKQLDDQFHVKRILTVDSMHQGADGRVYSLSYRDSLYAWGIHRWQSPAVRKPDSVMTGRFRIVEKPGAAELGISAEGADVYPAEFGSFFRFHVLTPDQGAPSNDTLGIPGEVRIHRNVYKITEDNAAYAPGLGLVRWNHLYNVYNTIGYTAPERYVEYALTDFNGRPVKAGTQTKEGNPETESAADFSPVVTGRSWSYLGLRKIDSGSTTTSDSISRSIKVDSKIYGVTGEYSLTLRDSLYARTLRGFPTRDTVLSISFTVTDGVANTGTSPGIGIWNYDPDPSFSDALRFFNGKHYPAREVAEEDFPQGRLAVFRYREESPGTLSDSMLFAGGVGLVRRAKTLYDGRTYREEFKLVGFMGLPFDATPVSLAGASGRPTRLSRPVRSRFPAAPAWSGRNALGKMTR